MVNKKKYTLGKAERLKSRKRIEQLFKEGKSFSTFPVRVVYLFGKLPVKEGSFPVREDTNRGRLLICEDTNRGLKDKDQHIPSSFMQAGFSVSTRHFKKAVDRNRIKRQMREAYRLQKKNLQEKLYQQQKCLTVFFIYQGSDLPAYNLIQEKINAALSRLQKMTNENTKGHT